MNRTASRQPLAPSVLRDIGMQAEPRVLLRPSRAGKPASEGVPRIAPVSAPAQERLQGIDANLEIPSTVAAPSTGQGNPRSDIQSELQQAFAAARQQGFEQGMQAGHQQGLAEGHAAAEREWRERLHAQQETMQLRLAHLDQLLAALPGAIAARIDAAQDDMVALCHAALCRLLGDSVPQHDSVVSQVRQAILECCGEPGRLGGLLAVHVHPQDLERLRNDQSLQDWLQQQGAHSMYWQADAQIGLGGCLVRSTQGTLDARLEIQLAALQDILLQGRQSALPEAGS